MQQNLEQKLKELAEQKDETQNQPRTDHINLKELERLSKDFPKLKLDEKPKKDYKPKIRLDRRAMNALKYIGLALIGSACVFGSIKGIQYLSNRERPVSYYEGKYQEITKCWDENKEYKKKSWRGIAQSMILHGEELDDAVNKPLEKLKKELNDKTDPKLKEIYAKALDLDKKVNEEIINTVDNGYFFQAEDVRNRNFDSSSENSEREALHQFYKGVVSDLKRFSHDQELFSALSNKVGKRRNSYFK